jgi:hypothetical protein
MMAGFGRQRSGPVHAPRGNITDGVDVLRMRDIRLKGDAMRKTLTVLAAAATIAIAAVAAPTDAQARWRGWWIPGAIVGGLALGAIASGAYGPYYYGPGPYYYGPRCYWQRQWAWDGFSWRWMRVRVCY